VLVTLLGVLVLSAATFAALVRRWTTQRGRVVLSDWGKGKDFRIGNPEQAPAVPGSPKAPPRVVRWLHSKETMLLMLEGDAPTAPPARPAMIDAPAQSPALPAASLTATSPRWHVLVRTLEIESKWMPTGLRPAHASESFLDLYSLSSYPALGNVDRFVIYGTDTLAARTLSHSQARGLLPADIGLLLLEKKLILDFSERPFDPIEFDRMLALADQLVAHLPQPR
jgi:hypothetical protein